MRRFRLLAFFLFIFLLFPRPSSAAGSFSTDYNVTYDVKGSSDTHVNINVVLTNLTDNFYASSYDIKVGFLDIRDLKASDQDGQIKVSVKSDQEESTIELPFNSHIVGKGNKLNFSISFNTYEIAKNLSNVWNINIPGISAKNDFANFNVSVVYPSFLGKPSFIKPKLDHVLQNISGNTINFTRADLGESGISIAFGDFQIYSFDLIYHLQNSNLFPVKTEIALPPTTNYQQISIENIIPKPENVTIDKDGNWLAKYRLGPSKKVDIKVRGLAKVYLKPSKVNITSGEEKMYLNQADFWESKNPQIIKLARQLKTPRQIYDFVVKTLSYDFARIDTRSPRLGALNSLKNPQSAVCLEFTDLFVAISRAAGIPARAVNGYAHTDNSRERPLSFVKDILHAWPEYYDYQRNAWIMVDPTWGNTTRGVDYFETLDYDHFTFVINGANSSYPVPAGGYKYAKDLNSKDVNVSISSNFKQLVNSKPSLNMKEGYIAGLPITGVVIVENTGNSLSNNQTAYIYSNKLKPKYQAIDIPQIPPLGKAELSINFDKTPLLTNETDTIKISLGSKTAYKNIRIFPFFLDKWFLFGGVLIVFAITTISITYIGLRRLPFFKRSKGDNLRWKSDKPQEKSV